MTPSRRTSSSCIVPQQGPNVANELKKYALMTRMEAVSAILQSKGWEYKAKLKDKFWDTFMQLYKAKEDHIRRKAEDINNHNIISISSIVNNF
eukprot:g286.t1